MDVWTTTATSLATPLALLSSRRRVFVLIDVCVVLCGHAAVDVTACTATNSTVQSVIESLTETKARSSTALVVVTQQKAQAAAAVAGVSALALTRRTDSKIPKPKWHAPWKLMRVISGHNGWVRSVAVEPGNQWFATGAADRTIKVCSLLRASRASGWCAGKAAGISAVSDAAQCEERGVGSNVTCARLTTASQIWDLASGTLKLTLTGHVNAIRGLAVSPRHPYMFSVGEDKLVKCTSMCVALRRAGSGSVGSKASRARSWNGVGG